MNESSKKRPIMIFFSCAPEDKRYLLELKKHLAPLSQRGLFSFSDRDLIMPGTDTLQEVVQLLNSASLILLLISPDYFASHDCYNLEMKQALQLHQTGKAHLIPIMVRPVAWEPTELAYLPSLPENMLPVTSWSQQDAAFQSIVQGLFTLVEKLYPGSALPGTYASSPPKHNVSSPQKRYRQKLLNQVHNIWIAGVLHNLGIETSFIPLTMRSHPELVDNPLQDSVQESILPPHTLSPGTHIHQIYDDANGDLLILGEPGSGKTTLLLTLASVLLERARRDENAPIPLVLNLSEWGRQQKPLSQWIVDELHAKYKISPTLGKIWLDQDQLLLLLDGLDEVAHKQQSACLAAIEKFHDLHSLTSIVLCSRLQEYRNLIQNRHSLQLQRAIVIQPLTLSQIDSYLTLQGNVQTTLKSAIHADEKLQRLAENPLSLTLLTHTYTSTEDLSSFSEEQQTALFTLYVQRMLARRGRITRYTEKQVCSYLEHLATHMHLQNQTEFYIEQMQPNWLSSFGLFTRYRFLVNRCLDAIIVFSIWLVALMFAIIGNLLGSNHQTPLFQQFFAALSGSAEMMFYIFLTIGIFTVILFLAGALGVGEGALSRAIKDFLTQWWKGLVEAQRVELVETIIWPRKLLQPRTLFHLFSQWLLLVIITALLFGGFLAVTEGTKIGPDALFTQQCQQVGGHINMIPADTDTLLDCNPAANANSQQINKIRHLNRELFDTSSAISGGITGAISGAIYIIILSPLLALGFFWLNQVTWKAHDRKSLIKPSKGLRLALYNSFFIGLMSWFTFIVLYGVGVGLILERATAIKNATYESIYISIFGGYVFALITWLRFGGLASLQHLLMRLLLSQAHIIPWRYAHFLDFAAERLLLQKIGNGYMFYHQALLDYFAQSTTKASSHEPD